MKFIIRLFMGITALLFILIAAIKFVRNCSWREATGIAEEFWNEIKESCCRCCNDKADTARKA
ncbi:hypothetical protein ACFL1R_04780 [Candidatus Latescibacterota bacterium]